MGKVQKNSVEKVKNYRYRDKKRAERDVVRKALKKQKKEEEILLIDKSGKNKCRRKIYSRISIKRCTF